MLTLQGENLYLRALEPEDIQMLLHIENDESLWHVSETQTPFSAYSMEEYIANVHRDIYDTKQLRLVICTKDTQTVLGFVDIFDFDPLHLRAGVGIVIAPQMHRGKGYGKGALSIILAYAKTHLQLHQLYANIGEENVSSIALFKGAGFQLIGVKRDWRRFRESYTNELLFQHIF